MAFQTQLWHPTSEFQTPDSTTDFETQDEASAYADFLLSDAPVGTAVRVTDGQHTLEYRVAEDESSYVHYAPDDYPM